MHFSEWHTLRRCVKILLGTKISLFSRSPRNPTAMVFPVVPILLGIQETSEQRHRRHAARLVHHYF